MKTLEERIVIGPSESLIIPSRARVRVAGSGPGATHDGRHAAEVAVDEAALRIVHAHVLSNQSVEVAGVLLGSWPRLQANGRYQVHVIDAIVARHTRSSPAEVEWTADSWKHCEENRLARYPEGTVVVVGWYHTHPGHGIFFSPQDVSLHAAVFTEPWQIGLVLDPKQRTADFFSWTIERSRIIRYRFRWPEWVKETF